MLQISMINELHAHGNGSPSARHLLLEYTGFRPMSFGIHHIRKNTSSLLFFDCPKLFKEV